MANRPLGRIHRVRTLQLTLARAEEARAHAQVATEQAMSERIAQLTDAVAATSGSAVTLVAASRYRERLAKSAVTAVDRVRQAEIEAVRAAEDARAAKRDQSAVEKLMQRARADDLRREMRALEDAPAARKRHDLC
ncbi:MAG TPA: hypothetical protein VF636_12155 [Sphingomonas sp.]|jgi:hypothetical protein